jgi:hypothetical protein
MEAPLSDASKLSPEVQALMKEIDFDLQQQAIGSKKGWFPKNLSGKSLSRHMFDNQELVKRRRADFIKEMMEKHPTLKKMEANIQEMIELERKKAETLKQLVLCVALKLEAESRLSTGGSNAQGHSDSDSQAAD